jgi:arginyl-tRNA synthetase
MHVGHGRWAALGDAVARLLAHTGHEVEREFYVNDAGVQMDIFGTSLSVRYLQLCGIDAEMPENGYRGSYITDIAQTIKDGEGEKWVSTPAHEREAHLLEQGYREVLAHIQSFLHDFGVDFDCWFSERTLYAGKPNAVERAIQVLREAGCLYEKDGALWFRTTDYGDDKDRVLIKTDGAYTYFAADIAYHKDKLDRGFERLINIWGADHHGYVARMKAACAALGHPGALDVVIGQLVNLFRDGEAVRMSKRTGEMITFEELVDEVGADAARYWFLRRSTDQQVDFDIAVALEQSDKNPISYVQYAYARICSIIRKAYGKEGAADELVEALPPEVDLSRLTDPAELALVRKLGEFPDVVELSSRDLAPHKLAYYCEELASLFHHFYAHCRVMDESGQADQARLYLCDATRRCLRVAFELLGIASPERM